MHCIKIKKDNRYKSHSMTATLNPERNHDIACSLCIYIYIYETGFSDTVFGVLCMSFASALIKLCSEIRRKQMPISINSINSHKLFFFSHNLQKYTFMKSTCVYRSLSAVDMEDIKTKARPTWDHICIKCAVTAFGIGLNKEGSPSQRARRSHRIFVLR